MCEANRVQRADHEPSHATLDGQPGPLKDVLVSVCVSVSRWPASSETKTHHDRAQNFRRTCRNIFCQLLHARTRAPHVYTCVRTPTPTRPDTHPNPPTHPPTHPPAHDAERPCAGRAAAGRRRAEAKPAHGRAMKRYGHVSLDMCVPPRRNRPTAAPRLRGPEAGQARPCGPREGLAPAAAQRREAVTGVTTVWARCGMMASNDSEQR